METKNEIDKLAEMIQREFGAARDEREKMKGEMGSMKGEMGSMKSEMGSMKSEMGSMRSEMNERFYRVDERFDEVLGREDKIFKSLSDLETDNTMGAGAFKRQEDKLENHEERIIVAEKKLGIGAAI